jgi:hypothetical protein
MHARLSSLCRLVGGALLVTAGLLPDGAAAQAARARPSSYVRWGEEEGLCVSTRTLALSTAPCDSAAGRIAVRDAARNATLYGERRAVEEQGAGYRTLKTMARNSLEHAFLEGESLWKDARSFTPVAACAAAAGGLEGRRCREFAERSPKARLQWELERDFQGFEREVGGEAGNDGYYPYVRNRMRMYLLKRRKPFR